MTEDKGRTLRLNRSIQTSKVMMSCRKTMNLCELPSEKIKRFEVRRDVAIFSVVIFRAFQTAESVLAPLGQPTSDFKYIADQLLSFGKHDVELFSSCLGHNWLRSTSA